MKKETSRYENTMRIARQVGADMFETYLVIKIDELDDIIESQNFTGPLSYIRTEAENKKKIYQEIREVYLQMKEEKENKTLIQ